MKLLALDTSTEFLSLALQLGDDIYVHHQQAGATASQLILPQIQALLDTANITLKDLDGIAFGAGPGAFTGVRIACGVAQGLAFGAGLPVGGENTLMALAQASEAEEVLACLDARMGEIYHAVLVRDGTGWRETIATTVCKPELAPAVSGDGWVGVGSGWGVYAQALSAIYQANLTQIRPEVTPTASAILQLAIPIFVAGKAKSASEAMPIYIRNRVALTTQEREQGQRL